MRRWGGLCFLLLGGTLSAAAPDGTFTDRQCIECHSSESAAVHSYTTSKHGVLATLGNGPSGRAPDCVACHSTAAHAPSAIRETTRTCQQCHSPHYIQTLEGNGERMVEIGQMKLHEAEALLTRARAQFPAASLQAMETTFVQMQQHMTNLRLGVAHQSPDYQWWLGHPALDGDLLRLKGAYDELVRSRLKNRSGNETP